VHVDRIAQTPTPRVLDLERPGRALAGSRRSYVSGSRLLGLLLASFGCVLVGTLGLLHGGYFPTAWGWGALACLWIVFVTLLVSDRLALGRLEMLLFGVLGAFLAWTAVSASWSVAAPAAIRELERELLVLSALVAMMLLVRRHMRPVLGGVLGGIVIACAYGLATRLFPARLGGPFDAIAGYRLDEPLGYWNAVGLFASMGTLLAIGFAARGRTVAARAFGSAVPVVLVPTLYFTFSRGAWAALFLGLAVAVALDRRRLQLVSTIFMLSPLVAVAVWLCAREPDLNRRAAAISGAVAEGRRLALILVGLAVAGALVGPALQLAERNIPVGRRARVVFGGLVIVFLLGSVGLGLVHYGGPRHIARSAYDSLKAPPVAVSASGNLNRRLFSFSANGRFTQWRVALDDYRAHPWLGSGAGTYEFAWMKERPTAGKVRNAHNLYIEVLAELGPVGLGLLILALSTPVFAAIKVRRHPLVPIALGAYIAFLLHAAVDWDWQMPALTIAGLLCGVAILVVARQQADGRVLSRRLRITAVTAVATVAAFAFVGLMGNLAIAASNNAAANSNWLDSAKHAREAKRWMPWSSEPWRLQGEAQYVLGDFDAARANFQKAIAKDPNNWLLWADLATVGTHGTWRAPARRALQLNPLAPELAEFRKALGGKG
jgi:tetratricopeptide (TPR) repeat protein